MKATLSKVPGGLFLAKIVWGAVCYLQFCIAFWRYGRWLGDGRFPCRWSTRWPCLYDATPKTSDFDPHYLYHTAWAVRHLAANLPEKHVDISSCLRFVTIASAFVPIEFYDYRPADIKLDSLMLGKANLTNLPFEDASILSLSCMHVVEHVGLGRYGDPLDPKGDCLAASELQRVLAYEGRLIFVVPVGAPSLMYNAHRVYSYAQVVSLFPELNVIEFSLITDDGVFIPNADLRIVEEQRYGCGCFVFNKQQR